MGSMQVARNDVSNENGPNGVLALCDKIRGGPLVESLGRTGDARIG